MKKLIFMRIIFIGLCFLLILSTGINRNIFVAAYENIQSVETYPLVINEVMTQNRNFIQDEDGDYSPWLEIYNDSGSALSLEGFGLSQTVQNPFQWSFPDIVISPYSFITVWISGKDKNDGMNIHTNFKLGQKDNVIVLTSPANRWRSIFVLDKMYENMSYGCCPDGSGTLAWFDGGSKGTKNDLEPLSKESAGSRLADVAFSCSTGFYEDGFLLKMSHEDKEAEIRYTLDGSPPTKNSPLYYDGIKLERTGNKAAVVSACAFKKGYPKSRVVTHAYFIEEGIGTKYDIPVVSLVTDPINLFDEEKGIYIPGKVFEQWRLENPNARITGGTPANFNKRGKAWERQAYLEIIEPDGSVGLSQGIGIRVHGGTSAQYPNKSLRLLASKDYDSQDIFSYNFFHDAGKTEIPLSGVIMRTSGTDSRFAFFRDAFIQSLANTDILDIQRSQPCIAFINGSYYGIFNLRTLFNTNYFSRKYNIKEEDVVVIKNPTGDTGDNIQEGYVGDEAQYQRLYRFIEQNDMSNQSSFDYVQTQMDVDNYIEYSILQIYCGNDDWPANNVRIWRKRTAAYTPNSDYGSDGRWRWLPCDLDHGFGLAGKSYMTDSLSWATDSQSKKWGNEAWSTLMLRSLLKNETFRQKFVNRFADLLNTNFRTEGVLNRIDRLRAIYQPYVKDHIEKWNLHGKDIENWLDEIGIMREYAMYRPDYLRKYIIKYFNLKQTAALDLLVGEGGSVRVNTIKIEAGPEKWSGIYFTGMPVSMEAIPQSGYHFKEWEGTYQSNKTVLTVDLPAQTFMRAIFERDTNTDGKEELY